MLATNCVNGYCPPSMTVLKAHFDGKVIIPDTPVELPMNCSLEVQVRALEDKEADSNQLEAEFGRLAKQWKEETAGYALNLRRYAHPAYQAILSLGNRVVPLILKEVQARPDRWFEALRVLTKENPAEQAESFEAATKAWLDWGRRLKLIT